MVQRLSLLTCVLSVETYQESPLALDKIKTKHEGAQTMRNVGNSFPINTCSLQSL